MGSNGGRGRSRPVDRFAHTPAVSQLVDDEASRLMAEFGAGAALFITGQMAEAHREGRRDAEMFWAALLQMVSTPASLVSQSPDQRASAAHPAVSLRQSERLRLRWRQIGSAAARMRARPWRSFRRRLRS